LLCSDDEEPPACATSVPPVVPAEPAELDVAPRATRAYVKKISQTQARNLKRSKKSKEADVSVEAHVSLASSNNVGVASLLINFFSYTPSLTHSFLQALVKKFLDLSTECAGYLQTFDGAILMFNRCFPSVFLSLAVYLTPFRLFFADALTTANARIASLEAELRASQKAYDAATTAKAVADKSHKSALKKAEKALADVRKGHAQREQAVADRLHAISCAAESMFFDLSLRF
jgi:hypothetical protein